MRKYIFISLLILGGFCLEEVQAQNKGITNTTQSPFALLSSVGMGEVTWIGGFWKDRFDVCRDSMITNMWRLFKNDQLSHAFENFRIAAGLDTGSHLGPPFMDGDVYKWLEAVAAVYSVTGSFELDQLMDSVIHVIGLAQRPDGYIHTPVIIAQRNYPDSVFEFQDELSFEAYNFGHLMTAACIHYRATGKTSLLKIAKQAADFLGKFYRNAPSEVTRTAVCPSHYMGTIELYRTTRDPKYLKMAKRLFNIRQEVKNGTDNNQDRIPFRQQTKAVGHAVRANYLYAGAADLFMETGDSTLLKPLKLIWNDVVHRKMYITGACGALYDGVSPNGTSYQPREIQQIHQAYGSDYQLPNLTAHNETCANIGNVLWNWRMFQITGDAKYMDILELTLYNSVLSGISLNGKNYCYTNPLAYNHQLPFTLRWSKDRVPYIPLSFCCPPNVVRTIAEVNDYVYSLSDSGLWFNLYGSNKLATHLKNGQAVTLTQQTAYPWDGTVNIKFEDTPDEKFSVFLRIPGWCKGASVFINGTLYKNNLSAGSYIEISRVWEKSDRVRLVLPEKVQLIQANPLVEATRNQVAVKRGPIVYCLEGADLLKNQNLFNVVLPADIRFALRPVVIDNSEIVALTGNAAVLPEQSWDSDLYRPVKTMKYKQIPIQMIPYYAWDNRGLYDMTVWLPFDR